MISNPCPPATSGSFYSSEDVSTKQTRRRHKSEGQALDKPNYEHIKPPKVTKKTKTKKELENQEYVYVFILVGHIDPVDR